MKIDLTGNKAVITGAGSGIGRMIAITLAAAGAEVALADINLGSAQVCAKTITNDGGVAEAFEVDIASRSSVENLQQQIEDSFGTCDLIINNAGWNIGQPFLDNEPEFIEKVVALNLLGPMNMCQIFVAPLVNAGQKGTVVNISSDAGRVGSQGETAYAAAKGGVIAFSKSLAREMARYGINVNCVAPGPTDTPLFHLQPEKTQTALIRAIPLRRLGQPEEIAYAVAYLASKNASYITGQVLSVSGGLTMVD